MKTRLLDGTYLFLSSRRLTLALLVYAVLLVFVATLAQREIGIAAVQKLYFESFFLLAGFGAVKFPLAGGATVGALALLNIVFSGLRYSRFGVAGLGTSIAHMAVALLIVSGALQYFLRVDGNMTLLPNAESDTVVLSDAKHTVLRLPFSVRLKKFTEEKWAGSSIAKGYSSEIVFVKSGAETESTVSMNNPASFAGWTFYQMSYGRDGSSVLGAVKNPARLLPWLAVGMAFFGMIVVFLPRAFGRGGNERR